VNGDENLLIERYLTGQLNEAESSAFEERVASQPEFYRQIETILRFKEGLAILHQRGELELLMKGRRWPRGITRAVAAAAIIAGIALWVWWLPPKGAPGMLARSSAKIVSTSTTLPGGPQYLLIRTRDPSKPVEIELSGAQRAIELKVLPAESNSGEKYRITLERLSLDGRASSLQKIDDISPGADGYLDLCLDASQLAVGSYVLLVQTVGALGPMPPKPERFDLSLTPGR
jgi:hypothetical protein